MSELQPIKPDSQSSQHAVEVRSESPSTLNNDLDPTTTSAHNEAHTRRAPNIIDSNANDGDAQLITHQLKQMQIESSANDHTSPDGAEANVEGDEQVKIGSQPKTEAGNSEATETNVESEPASDYRSDPHRAALFESSAEMNPQPESGPARELERESQVETELSNLTLRQRVDETEAAAAALGRELAGVVSALETRAEASARATLEHSKVVARASDGLKDAVKAFEQSTMDMLRRAAEVRAQLTALRDLARAAEKVRRELFYLEIDATRLRNHAVKRMARAASAKSARAVQAVQNETATDTAATDANTTITSVTGNEVELQEIPSRRSNTDPAAD